MKIENKWLRYALAYHLSDYDGEILDAYYALAAANTEDEAEQVAEDLNLLRWQPYELDSWLDILTMVEDMAEQLQMVDDGVLYAD